MNRQEVKETFRQINPEITDRVIADSVLNSWCEVGEKEVAARARLIKGDTTIQTIIGTKEYNLTAEIEKFYDIDDFPGGGIVYDDERPLELTTIAELDQISKSWRTRDDGTPRRFYRRNQFLYLETPPDAVVNLQIYTVLISDPWDDDTKTPFNQFTHLEPFHYSMVLYLTKRAKFKVGKPAEQQSATTEFDTYVTWMKNEVNRGTIHTIQFKPTGRYYQNSTRQYR